MGLEQFATPEHLYSFLPKVCLENGVMPGGWDPVKPVVPAFDPSQKSPELIKKAFKFTDDRVLVEIIGEGKKYFLPRYTGPENKPQGIYCSYEKIAKEYLKILQ